MADRHWRGVVVRIARYTVGILALVWVLRQPDWGRVVDILVSVHPVVLPAVLVVTATGLLCRFSMWRVLLDDTSGGKFIDAVAIDLVISFINQITPSRISGRSIAPLAVKHYTDTEWTSSLAIAGVYTGLYALLYGIVSLVGLFFAYSQLDTGVLLVIAISTGLYGIVGGVILLAGRNLELLDALLEWPGAHLSRLPWISLPAAGDLTAFTTESSAEFKRLTGDSWLLVGYATAWLAGLVVFPGLRFWLLIEGVQGGFSPVFLIPLYLVMAYSVTVLPLTPGGVGVAEASATFVFTAVGMSGELVVPIVLVDRFLGVYIPALLGWFPLLNVDFSEYAFENA